VDGDSVGTLERLGRRYVNGFEVSKGEHTVELRTSNCETRPEQVTLGPSRIAILTADFEDRMSAGSMGCVVFFR
jgi:hypothetical protein